MRVIYAHYTKGGMYTIQKRKMHICLLRDFSIFHADTSHTKGELVHPPSGLKQQRKGKANEGVSWCYAKPKQICKNTGEPKSIF